MYIHNPLLLEFGRSHFFHPLSYPMITGYIMYKRGGADVPLFETIKTNAGTQPKNELQL